MLELISYRIHITAFLHLRSFKDHILHLYIFLKRIILIEAYEKCRNGDKYCLVLIVHKFKWNLPGISNKKYQSRSEN